MAEERYLNESGLLRFWNTKIKPLIYKKATLQSDLVVKNPRVTVDLPDGYTFRKGSTMEELFRYLYRHVYDEASPELSVQLPTVTTSITGTQTIEINDSYTYTVSKGTFNQGKIGTCVAPFEEEPHQERIPSGSTEKPNTFKIYSGSTNKPSECTTEPEMVDNTVTGTLTAINVGDNDLGIYYCGTVDYTGSTASSVTSYNNPASVSGVSSFSEGTTKKTSAATSCVTFKVIGYYPSFGNISNTSTEASPTTISNLGNKMNVAGTTEFYYGGTDTTTGNNKSFEIYFPATLTAVIEYKDPITQAWTSVPTTTTSGHFATMPAKDNTSRYPNNPEIIEGKEYKLVRQASGYTYGPRHYRITLLS